MIHIDIDEKMWNTKLRKITDFQKTRIDLAISREQISRLIQIYNKYKSVFLEIASKAQHFCC